MKFLNTIPDAEQILVRVPEVTVFFWITKILTTGMGEVFSDYLVQLINPIIAVALAGIILVISLVLQFIVKRYRAWNYWFVVTMISIFGTMVADVVHVVIGIQYLVSTVFFLVVLGLIFVVWHRIEKTLSVHSIYTPRRELFYWCTVMITFALGTAAGDMTASTMHLGYFSSGVWFTILLVVPALGYWLFGLNGVFAFWFSYIMTRPVGASFSDWISVPANDGGIGQGKGWVSLILTLVILILVGYLSVSRKDMVREPIEKIS